MGFLLGVEHPSEVKCLHQDDVERIRQVAAVDGLMPPTMAGAVTEDDQIALVWIAGVIPTRDGVVAVGRLTGSDPLAAEPTLGLHSVLHIEGRTVGR